VCDDLAHGACSARSGARIATLLLEASEVGWTVSVDETLWSAAGWGSHIAFLTGTGSNTLLGSAVGEGTTR